jgi:hypothetical protein
LYALVHSLLNWFNLKAVDDYFWEYLHLIKLGWLFHKLCSLFLRYWCLYFIAFCLSGNIGIRAHFLPKSRIRPLDYYWCNNVFYLTTNAINDIFFISILNFYHLILNYILFFLNLLLPFHYCHKALLFISGFQNTEKSCNLDIPSVDHYEKSFF